MCGPLACSVLARQEKPKFLPVLLYQLGRCLSYTAMGALFGAITTGFASLSLSLGTWLARGAALALFLAAIWPFLLKTSRPASLSWPWLRQLTQSLLALPLPTQAFGLGLITVLLPCMTLHPLLLASMASASVLTGAATLFAFYLGTVPVMFGATYVPVLLSSPLRNRFLPIFGRIFLLFAAIITFWRTL